MKVPFTRPSLTHNELAYVEEVLRSGKTSGGQTFSARCIERLKELTGSPGVLLTHSCTAALEMTAILCDIGPGDEVIMPSFTFSSTANAFALRGADIVFVDIKTPTMNIDPEQIKAAISEKTKAIVVVHYAGVACEMDSICDLARERGIFVIEDAAQCVGAYYKGRHLGSIGQLGAFSFHQTKNLGCGEGGALLINDEKMLARADVISEKGTNRKAFFQGQVDKYTWVDIGSSFLMSEIEAAVLLSQLEQMPALAKRRMDIFQRYYRYLAPALRNINFDVPDLEVFEESNAHIFYAFAPSGESRAKFLSHLNEQGIGATFHFIPLHSSPAGRKFGRSNGDMQVTEKYSQLIVRIPIFPDLTEDQIERIVECASSLY